MLTAFLFSYYYNIPSREGLDGDIRAGEGGAGFACADGAEGGAGLCAGAFMLYCRADA